MVDLRACCILAALAVAAACSAPNPLFEIPDGGGSGSGDASTADGPGSTTDMSSGTDMSSTITSTSTTSTSNSTNSTTLPPGPECGNGVQEPGEECDDGNLTPGDGCELNCRPLFQNYEMSPIPIPVENASSLAVADFNGDGLSDVALALNPETCEGACVRTYRNTGDGLAFEEIILFPAILASPRRMVAGEWNGDGKPDLVGADGVNVFALMQGANMPFVFGLPGKAPTLFAANFDGDDGLDLLLFDPGNNVVRKVVANKMLPLKFDTPVTFSVGSPLERLAVADVDGDGANDLVYTTLLGSGEWTNGGFHTRLGLDPNAADSDRFESQSGKARALAVGAFGPQPWPNIVISDPGPGVGEKTVQFFLNKGGGSFERVQTAEGEPEVEQLRIVPLGNGDGNNVLALAPTALQLFTLNGDEIVSGPSFNFSGVTVDLAVGQFGGDDGTDLAVLTTFGCYILINRAGEP